jgi:glycosyltransferase involved in cell wall biosynthesis
MYGKFSGEEAVVHAQKYLLSLNGVTVSQYFRSSTEIDEIALGKARAFVSGIYNHRAVKEVREKLLQVKPDIVHIHNLYPFISPAILPAIKKQNIPVVMTVHNYRLLCPNGLFYNRTGICERCTGRGKELNCIAYNCEDSFFKSTGYALRNTVARYRKYYVEGVDAFLCLTDFQRRKLVESGYPDQNMFIIPNMFTQPLPENLSNKENSYIAYAGRISREKGIDLLIEAARSLPDIHFKLAGTVRDGYKLMNVPENVELCGVLQGKKLEQFYRNANALVHASICYEGFPMVLPEAMAYRLPVIAPRIAGIPEIIEDGYNGVLFSMGNAAELAKKIEYIWENPEKAQELGQNGYQKLKKEYLPDVYYEKLMSVYKHLIKKQKSTN